jgi:hypothetical protein
MENENRGRQSPIILLVMALVGLYSLPWLGLTGVGGAKSGPSPIQNAAKGQQSAVQAPPVGDNDESGDALARLRPLVELASDGRSVKPEDHQTLLAQLDTAGYQSRQSLIAIVPNPDRTTNGYLFDLSVDALQRALESWGYILERYRFPWGERKAGSKVEFEAKLGGRPWVGGSVGTQAGPSGEGEPGLLVFRKKYELMLVFLVLETPTQGLNKAQLATALDEVDALDVQTFTPGKDQDGSEDADPHPIFLLGPNFTGTEISLGQVLDSWLKRPHRVNHPWASDRIVVTAGGASDIDPETLKVGGLDRVDFRTTRNRRFDILESMLRFMGLDPRQSEAGAPSIALLAESNTGFGQALDRSDLIANGKHKHPWDLYDFPLHISRIRGAYERQGMSGDATSQLFRSAGRLGALNDESGQPRDLLPSQTPDLSTRHDELALIQVLTSLSRSRYKAVGIFATNPYDAIFLARMVRRFDPSLLIFTTEADLLLTQPQSMADLRGVLVGSTYPLYPHNHAWSYRHDYPELVYFFSESAQAMYNATILAIGELKGKPSQSWPLDYDMPFEREIDEDNKGEISHWPPIWISMVGNRGLYPVHVESAGKRGDVPPAKESAPQDPSLKVFVSPADDTPSVERQRHWFQPWYHWSWWILELALLIVLILLLLGVVWTKRFRREGLDLEPFGPLMLLVGLVIWSALNWPFLAPGSVKLEIGLNLDMGVWLTAYGGALIALAGLIVTVVTRLSKLFNGRPRTSWLVGTAFAGAAGVLFGLNRYWPAGVVDTWLLRERIVTSTSGVSPLFPLVFVSVAWGSWFYAQARRRGLTGEPSALPSKNLFADSQTSNQLDKSLAVPLERFYDRLGRLGLTFRAPWPSKGSAAFSSPLGLRLLLFGMVSLLVANACISYQDRIGNAVFFGWAWAFWALFWTAAVLLAYQTFLLAKAWDDLSDLLRQASRLPLVRAFDRLPTRLGRWVFEAPRQGWRSALVLAQCRSVAALLDDEDLSRVLEHALGSPDKPTLTAQLEAVRSAPVKLQEALKSPDTAPNPDLALIEVLAEAWKGLPVTFTHGDPAADGNGAEDWPGLTLSKPDADEATAKGAAADRARAVAWLVAAEDYLALRILHWIGRAQAQVWVMIRAVVVGVIALLLAVDSYPFRDQARVGSVLSVLVALVAVAVMRVVVGLNRDELISRVTNSVPGRLKLDRDLLSNLLTYVLPLVGLLGSLSYDVSDLLRSWLDPLFRGPM